MNTEDWVKTLMDWGDEPMVLQRDEQIEIAKLLHSEPPKEEEVTEDA